MAPAVTLRSHALSDSFITVGFIQLHLRFSILTATVITVSALDIPYAVASTTFPNAPEPRVLPVGAKGKKNEWRRSVKAKDVHLPINSLTGTVIGGWPLNRIGILCNCYHPLGHRFGATPYGHKTRIKQHAIKTDWQTREGSGSATDRWRQRGRW